MSFRGGPCLTGKDPIAVGKGMRRFDEGESIPLKLLSSQTFETG
jgi:hypothetical protein